MNQTLRIFRHYNSFCLVDLDDNIWEIDFKPPNSFNLCHVQFSGVDEEKFKKSSKPIPDSLASIIRNHIGEKDNYKEIRKVICMLFSLGLEEFDEILGKNDTLYNAAVELLGPSATEYSIEKVFKTLKFYYKNFGGDLERTKKFVKRWEMPSYSQEALIDVFGKHTPSESWILHKFYTSWGIKLDEIMGRVLKKYPNFCDIDIAADLIHKEMMWAARKDYYRKKVRAGLMTLTEYKNNYRMIWRQ